MNSTWITDRIGKQVYLHILATEKYKMVSVFAQLESELLRDRATKLALLPQVLMRGTKRYPETTALIRAFDDLYGAAIGARVNKHGDRQTVEFTMQVPHEGYLTSADGLFASAMQLFAEVIFDPKTEDGVFSKSDVDAEVVLHAQRIENLVNDKIAYAGERCVQEMCQGEPFGIARLGYVEDLPAVTPTALYTTYKELLESSALHIYIVGPVDAQMVKETCSREFGRFMNDQFAEHLITTVSSADLSRQMSDKAERVVIEEMEVSQGKLNVGLRAQSSYEKDDYPALVVYNGILGGFPHSKLFINVREKSSLAYYASSRLEGLKGLLFIQSGIQMSNFERAKDIIKQQLEDMRKGLITDDELNFTKKGLINQYLQSDDQPFTGAVLQMYSRFTGRERSVTQLIEDVRKVTKEDVVAVAQGITSELVYFLRDKEVSQDESQDL